MRIRAISYKTFKYSGQQLFKYAREQTINVYISKHPNGDNCKTQASHYGSHDKKKSDTDKRLAHDYKLCNRTF